MDRFKYWEKKLNLQQQKREIHEQIWDTGVCVFILCKNKPDRSTCLFIPPPPGHKPPPLPSCAGQSVKSVRWTNKPSQALWHPKPHAACAFLAPF